METWCKAYSPEIIFDQEKLLIEFNKLKQGENLSNTIRLKAILKTNAGWYVFNQVADQLTCYETNERKQSLIEILGSNKPLILEEYQAKL